MDKIKFTQDEEDRYEEICQKQGPIFDNYEMSYRKQLLRVFNIQERDILSQIRNQKQIKIPNFFKRAFLSLYVRFIGPEERVILENEGKRSLEQFSINGEFQISDPEVQVFINRNIRKFAGSIDNETSKQIRKVIGFINNEGLGVDEATREVKKVFTTLKTSRLEKIVRTEVIRASTFANISAWKQSGVVSQKIWFTAQDERVCPNCGPMHGRILDLNKNFFKIGQVAPGGLKLNYEDIQGPPLHPNCRCTLVPVTD